jgi:hypothetical protein
MELSRMYLGMHAANQVLLGASMGTWTAMVSVFVLLPYFEAYCGHLKDTSDTATMTSLNRKVLLAFAIIAVVYISMMEMLDAFLFT